MHPGSPGWLSQCYNAVPKPVYFTITSGMLTYSFLWLKCDKQMYKYNLYVLGPMFNHRINAIWWKICLYNFEISVLNLLARWLNFFKLPMRLWVIDYLNYIHMDHNTLTPFGTPGFTLKFVYWYISKLFLLNMPQDLKIWNFLNAIFGAVLWIC